MFERFTERARFAVTQAEQAALAHGAAHVDCEHLLLGLAREGEGLAFRILQHFELTRELLTVEAGHGEPDRDVAPEHRPLPFTAHTKEALEMALREALERGQNCIGTEHLLLGLVRGENSAVELLGTYGVSPDAVRDTVAVLTQGPARKPPQPETAAVAEQPAADQPEVSATQQALALAERLVTAFEGIERHLHELAGGQSGNDTSR